MARHYGRWQPARAELSTGYAAALANFTEVSNQASSNAIIDAAGIDMRTTVTVDDELIARAAELTARDEKSALIRLGLEALIERESTRRLALLGGTDAKATSASRQRDS